jgi:hypothetical protein
MNAENSSVQETFILPDQYTHVAGLKKKEKPKGGSERNLGLKNFRRKRKTKGTRRIQANLCNKKMEVMFQNHKHMNQFLVLPKFLWYAYSFLFP